MAHGNDEVIEQKDWMARSTLKFFERNKNAVMARRVVELGSDLAKKVLSRTWEPVSRDAHYITKQSRGILADRVSQKIYQEDEIFKAETAITTEFTRIDEYLDRRIEQATKKLANAGEDPSSIICPTERYAALCSTRVATDWLNLLAKADIYLRYHEYLYIIGELSDVQNEALRAKLNNERDVRNNLHALPRKTMSQFTIIRRICSGAIEQRLGEREQQSLRDKAQAKAAKEAGLAASQDDMNQLAGTSLPAGAVSAA
ncbi:MAG: hypothetical protein OEL20_04835 [Sulfuritalea sp.]|nr:hypothetical protein [Sulfuritalea sp.]